MLTGDLAYEPRVTDTAPFYVKVRMLPEQKQPVVVHFWGRRPFSPWYTPHANINRKGMFLGIGTGAEDKPGVRVAAGEESPWLKLPHLAYGGLNRISSTRCARNTPEPEACFEIAFSSTPSEAGLIKAAPQGAATVLFAVDLVDYRLITETDGAAASLEMARRARRARRNSPAALFTGMSLSERRSTGQAVANEPRGPPADRHRRRQACPNFFFHLTGRPAA